MACPSMSGTEAEFFLVDLICPSSSDDDELSSSDGEEVLFTVDNEEPLTASDVEGESKVNVPDPFESAEWFKDENFETPKDFIGDSGAVHDLSSGSSELSYFKYMLGGEHIFEKIARSTNKYAAHRQKLVKKGDRDWFDTTPEEIMAYVGILIYMGVYDLSEASDYWRNPDIECSIVSNCMTYNRYINITKYLHISDIEEQNENDALQKIRPVLEIMENFHTKYKPERELVVDEAIVALKGRHHIKKYVKMRPTKCNLKVWVLSTPHGYVLRGNVNLGKKGVKDRRLLLGSQVIIRLLDGYLGLHHHVYFDSFFSSVQLLEFLLRNNTYACAASQPHRKDWPKELKLESLNLKRGEYISLQSNGVTATVWCDNIYVCMLSTNCDPRENVRVVRKTGKGNERVVIPCPLSVAKYKKFMGGVDRAEHKRNFYSLGRPATKWWKYLFGFVMNTAIVNSFILYCETNQPATSKHGVTQKEYRKALYRQMIGNFSSRKIAAHRRNAVCTVKSCHQSHKITKIDGRKKVCVKCSEKKKRKLLGYASQTSWKCKNCDLPLCRIGCFLEFHQEKGVEVEN